ncbi:hypothetical protein GOP47_0014968 [Adiantum capillus-veneris]|uniref:Uncharacterized protein n=1 Tax=Adiantum capillus-veneris TaxID=13818 RepID=A0A9D4UMR0_ADICA|nr:hypothetical protein GOP47_0014968 [Adiantum capillus-veneris]
MAKIKSIQGDWRSTQQAIQNQGSEAVSSASVDSTFTKSKGSSSHCLQEQVVAIGPAPRAIRRRLTKHQAGLKTLKQKKKETYFPKWQYALKA